MELAIAIHGVMEIGNGLVELCGREPGKELLESTKGNGTLTEFLGRLGLLQAQAVFDEGEETPIFSLFVYTGILTILRMPS